MFGYPLLGNAHSGSYPPEMCLGFRVQGRMLVLEDGMEETHITYTHIHMRHSHFLDLGRALGFCFVFSVLGLLVFGGGVGFSGVKAVRAFWI